MWSRIYGDQDLNVIEKTYNHVIKTYCDSVIETYFELSYVKLLNCLPPVYFIFSYVINNV